MNTVRRRATFPRSFGPLFCLLLLVACKDPNEPDGQCRRLQWTANNLSPRVLETTFVGVTAFDARGRLLQNPQIRFRSENPAVAAVDSVTGMVSALAVGTARIIATCTPGAASDSIDLRVRPPLVPFTLTKLGNGQGFLTSTSVLGPGGTSYEAGSTVGVSAAPAAGSVFGGWGGAAAGCGTALRCNVVVAPPGPVNVTATFNAGVPLAVTAAGPGGLLAVAAGPAGGSPPPELATLAVVSSADQLFPPNSVVNVYPVPNTGAAFVRWTGDCSGDGSCTLVMNAPKRVGAVFAQTFSLSVATLGDGVGQVFSTPAGGRHAEGSTITLRAVPAAGSTFRSWSGDCAGTEPQCSLTVTRDLRVTALFDRAVNQPGFTIAISVAGDGTGTVTRSLPGPAYPAGTTVILTASPATGSEFAGWSGDCAGTSLACSLTVSRNMSVTASFRRTTQTGFTITVMTAGTGSGTVTRSPAGPTYPSGTVVTLTAVPASGSTFAGWSGSCTGTATTCTLTMTTNRTVTATFNSAGGVSDISGAYAGTFRTDAVSFCPAQNGTWSGRFTVTGTVLSVTWFDSYHGTTTSATTTLNGRSFSVSVYSGDDRVTLTGTFATGSPVRVSGTLVGPVCFGTARPNGTWEGTRTGN